MPAADFEHDPGGMRAVGPAAIAATMAARRNRWRMARDEHRRGGA